MAITKEQAIDILDKFDFFQGQRAGRELWNDKPFEVQEQDIKDFSNGVALLKEYISDVVPKSEWISVEERLPKEDIRVLVCIADNPYNYATMDTDRIFNGKWVRWSSFVRYWMPLPEAPKMKGGAE